VGMQNDVPMRTLFNSYMADADARAAFQFFQWQMINEPLDAKLGLFFNSKYPALAGLYSAIKTAMDKELDEFSLSQRINNTKMTLGMTPRYDVIYKMVQKTAADLGFSPEAIKNIEIFIDEGDVNAFTVSGNQNRIIIVLQSELINKLRNSEIRGVLAHEMGHIRSEHTIKQTAVQFMMLAIGIMVTGNVKAQEAFFKGAKYSLRHAIRKHHSSVEDDEASSNEIAQLFMETMGKIVEMSGETKAQMINQFIELAQEANVTMNAPQITTQYFEDLMNTAHTLDSVRISTQQYMKHMKTVSNSFSKTFETSADNYAAAESENEYFASAVLKLLGHTFKTGKERENFFKKIQEQYADVIATTEAEQRAPFEDKSHPPLPQRLTEILQKPVYPSIIFANPFLRLLSLDDSLNDHALASGNVSQILGKMLSEIDRDLSDDTLPQSSLPFVLSQYNAMKDAAGAKEASVGNILRLRTKLQHDIVASIMNLGLANSVNPRFENFIQYYARNRLSLALTLQAAQKVMLTSDVKEQELYAPIFASFKLKMSQVLPLPQALLNALNVELEKSKLNTPDRNVLVQRIAILSTVMNSNSTEALLQARNMVTSVRKVDGSTSRRRLPMENDEIAAELEDKANCLNLLQAAVSPVTTHVQLRK
jgi:Zn-dependent protease with chaperone function